MKCVRCFDKHDDQWQHKQKEPDPDAEYIYNGYSVCFGCLCWIRNYERTVPLIWKPWDMNLRLELTKKPVTKKKEKKDG